jgi:OOP family OmpA-OmpF porin
MRKLIAPILSAVLMIGLGSFEVGCGSPPPPKVKVKARKAPKHTNFDYSERGLKLPGAVLFRTGTADLDPVSDAVLEVVLDYLTSKPEITLLRIEGHTDSDGSPPANQTLSERRALAVAHWLVDAGIDCRRLIAVGFGETKPLVPNNSAENKAQNRRVAFLNAAVNGKNIGGMPIDGMGHIAGDTCRR